MARHGAHVGTIDSVELRHGDPFAIAHIGGMRFDIACDVERAYGHEREPARFAFDARGVNAWVSKAHVAREACVPPVSSHA
jgi:molybdate transport system permease protein